MLHPCKVYVTPRKLASTKFIYIGRLIVLLYVLFSSLHLKAGMKDSVYAYILKADIKHPEIVLRQAILETGWFQSKHLMKRNNLFAFRSTKNICGLIPGRKA